MLDLLWLEAAALDEAVSKGFEQAKIYLNSRGTLYELVAFAQPLKGLSELPEVVVDPEDLIASFEFFDNCGYFSCELAGKSSVSEPGEVDADLFLEHADQGRKGQELPLEIAYLNGFADYSAMEASNFKVKAVLILEGEDVLKETVAAKGFSFELVLLVLAKGVVQSTEYLVPYCVGKRGCYELLRSHPRDYLSAYSKPHFVG